MPQCLKALNWQIGVSTLLLTILGLVSLYSLAPEDDASAPLHKSHWIKQAAFASLGACAMIATASIATPARLQRWSYFLAGVGVLSLVAVLLFGRTVNHARSWFDLGGIAVQPSEFARLFTVLALARFASRTEAWTDRRVLSLVGLASFPILLVAKQPDLGMSLVLLSGLAAVLIAAPVPRRTLIELLVLAILLVPLAYTFALKPYQRDRIAAMLWPDQAKTGQRDQQEQALRLVAAGGLGGRGLGAARLERPYTVPERHNDFIFTVIAEETGFLGTVLVLSLFAMILQLSLRASVRTRDPFTRLALAGLSAQLAAQVISNIGMNLGLLPVTGLTLPFVSYGGSSLLACFLQAGCLMSLAGHWTPVFSGEAIPEGSYSLGLPLIKKFFREGK